MKNKVDYRLVNILLIMGIIYLAISTSGYWMGIITRIFNIILPFFFAFVLLGVWFLVFFLSTVP